MIKPQEDLFPFCIVWTVLPCLSWLMPLIGHAGICSSDGTIYDFLGYQVNVGKMTFAKVKKYVRLYPESQDIYDKGIQQANLKYMNECHNLCCNNCHHHVAEALNRMNYDGKDNWTQFDVWWMCIWRSEYVSWCDLLIVYLPFLIIAAIVLGFVFGLN